MVNGAGRRYSAAGILRDGLRGVSDFSSNRFQSDFAMHTKIEIECRVDKFYQSAQIEP